MRSLRLLPVLVAFAVGLPLAQASTIYWYTGNNFQSVNNDGGAWATESQSITAWFQVASPLAPNAIFNLTPVHWSLSDGSHTLGPSTPDVDTFALTIFTDASANFSFWSFLASAPDSAPAEPARVTLSTSSSQDLSVGFFTGGVSNALNEGSPGNWRSSTVSAAAEPYSAALCAVGGLLLLAAGLRKRHRDS